MSGSGSGSDSGNGSGPGLDPVPPPVRIRGRHTPAVPFMLRRRQRSRLGPLLVAVALLAGFVGVTFAIGYLVGRMLL